jgi:hypothetical protein
MGILVADEKTFTNGLILSNFVVSVKGCVMELTKIPSTTTYRIFYKIYYYLNQNAYDSNSAYIQVEMKHLDVQGDISSNIFTLIYNNIKSEYTNTTDI